MGLLVHRIYTNFANAMSEGQKDTIKTRAISIAFIVMALAVFKPFGLEAWQWMGMAHLLAIFLLGALSCLLTEVILKHVVRKPRSLERGVDYIISRNLWFQLINTPIISLLICLYRHFVMSDLVPGNRQLNEHLKRMHAATEHQAKAATANGPVNPAPTTGPTVQPPATITLTGTTSETVTLQISDLLYIEAVGNYVKVYRLKDGQAHTDMLRATSKQIEEELRDYVTIVRCHRAFLVNLRQVEQVITRSGTMQLLIKHCNDSLPVSRSNMAQVKSAINGM